MQLTDYQLEHLIFLVQTDLNGLNSTIKDYEEIIDASTFKKENPSFIKTVENTLIKFQESKKERTSLLQKLQIKANKSF